MRTSFIVVNYNGEKTIEKCINSILNQSIKNFELLVIDNASKDKSIEYLQEMAKNGQLELIKNRENLGYIKAVNFGIETTNSEFIALINNDAFIKEDWLEQMLLASKDETAGIFASKILYPNGLINSAGHVIYRGFAVMERGWFEKDSGQYDDEVYVAGACGAAAFYRRKLFEDIGLFDEDYFMYNEDVDLSLRALLFGWKIRYVPKAVAYHLHSASTGFMSDFSVYYNSRNWVWSILKNVPTRVLIKEFPFFILRNLTSIAFFVAQGRFSILKSKLDALRDIRKVLKKREELQKKRRFERFEDYIDGFGWKVLRNVWLHSKKRRDNNANEV
ncbi:MAG: glycosyltransferase family 2 protein [Archaeoglobaceae archaeon]